MESTNKFNFFKMSSAKLFSEKLNKLEKLYDKIDDLNNRLNQCESKINQLIDEITPILNSHAEAIKKLLNRYNASC